MRARSSSSSLGVSRSVTFVACVGVLASALVAVVSCTSDAETVNPGGSPDAQSPSTTDAGKDTSAPNNASDSGSDAAPFDDAPNDAKKTDGSDATPPTPAACSSFPPMVCDFNGTCPAFAALIASPPGEPNFAADAGLDGSVAFVAYVPDGGAAQFGMPFQDFTQNMAPVTGCHVTCEANMRVASGASVPMSVIIGGKIDTFQLRLEDGGYVQTVPSTNVRQEQDASATSDWVHVTVRLSPPQPDGGGGGVSTPAMSEITIEAGAAITTSTVVIPDVGQQMRFGASVAVPSTTEPVRVYFDDIICRVTD